MGTAPARTDPSATTVPTRYALFSPEWLGGADSAFAALPADESAAIRVALDITDAPEGTADALDILMDLTTGALRFAAGHSAVRPTLAFTLTHADAGTLLFGDQTRRTRLFEHGGLRLEGAFLFVFFLDRILQQDVSGGLARLRAETAGLAHPQGPPPARRAHPPGTGQEDEAAAVEATRDTLPRTMAVLRAELGRTTPGAQLYVSHAPSRTAVSVALGDSRPHEPFTRRSWPIWYCCSKAVGAVAVGQLWERGLVDPLRPVAAYLPWFEGEGRENITLFQLLTHTTPVPMALDPLHGTFAAPAEVRREQLRTMRIPPGAEPGTRINYAPWWAWFLLADIVRAVDGRSYERYLTEEVLAPCGMTDTRMVLTPEEYREAAGRLPLIHITGGGFPAEPTQWYATEDSCTRPIPGLNMRGPIQDLGRFFETLLADGQGTGGRILRPQTVMAMTARHRVGLTDAFGNADWGLGFRLESHHLGKEYTAFSHYASRRAFGHYGLWTSVAFADPDTGVVAAVHLNGKASQDEHQERMLAIGDAIHHDLGLV
ncbi:serine hydrolase domain-containing protein [Streptomyces sp. NPDC059922]|uniref:serine hydrolase domain-containing protein n=1 Tax=Streptomyces sp. NPDC059922 TaxID=3347005 RepID=UPI00365AD3C2